MDTRNVQNNPRCNLCPNQNIQVWSRYEPGWVIWKYIWKTCVLDRGDQDSWKNQSWKWQKSQLLGERERKALKKMKKRWVGEWVGHAAELVLKELNLDSQLIVPPFPLILSTLYFLAFFYFKALHIPLGHLQATSGPIGHATFDLNLVMAHDVIINGRDEKMVER